LKRADLDPDVQSTRLLSGIFWATIALTPIKTLSPTRIPPMTLAPAPMKTLSPITGIFATRSGLGAPMVTWWCSRAFLPIFA
jgi:hypothetical protein